MQGRLEFLAESYWCGLYILETVWNFWQGVTTPANLCRGFKVGVFYSNCVKYNSGVLGPCTGDIIYDPWKCGDFIFTRFMTPEGEHKRKSFSPPQP